MKITNPKERRLILVWFIGVLLGVVGCNLAYAVNLGWDPDGDYGVGDSWAAQVDLDDYSIEGQGKGIRITMPGTGADSYTATSIHAYIKESATANGHDVKAAIYDSGGTKVTNAESACNSTISTTYSWVEFTFSTPPSLVGGSDYFITINVGLGAGTLIWRGGNGYGDCTNPLTGVLCDAPKDDSITAPCATLDASVTLTGADDRTAAIYLEYESAAAGGVNITPVYSHIINQ